MEIPQLPTDSLYKFSAVAGITIFLVSTYFAIQKTIELNKLTADIGAKVALNMTESNIFKQKIDYLEELLKNRYKNSKGTILSKDHRGIVYTNDHIRDLKADINNRFDKSRIESTNNNDLFARHSSLIASYKIIISICSFFSVVGLATAGIGFYFWKTRIQDLEDKILAQTLINLQQPRETVEGNP